MRLHVRATELVHRRLVLLVLSVLFALILSRVAHAQSTSEAVYRLPDSVACESRGPQPRESLPRVVREMDQWLAAYLKNRSSNAPTKDQEAAR